MTQRSRMAGVNQLTTMGVCPICEALVSPGDATLKCAHCAGTCHEICALKRKEFTHGGGDIWRCDLCYLAPQQSSNSKISNPDSVIKKTLPVIYSLCEATRQVLEKSSQMSCARGSSALHQALSSLLTIQNEQMEIVKALTSNMDEECKSKLGMTGTPATPPPTPTFPSMLADRRSANRNSTGNIVPLRTPTKGRVADVIDSFGRRRSSSCSESLPESPKYIGSPFLENGDGIKKSQSFFAYEGILPSQVDSKPTVNTVPDARPTQPQQAPEKMDLSFEKESTPAKAAETAAMVADLDAEDYNMSHERRGYFLILNHDKFDCPNMDRPGSEVDVNELKTTAEALGFEPLICNNLNYQEILNVIEKMAGMDHSNADCLAIVVLTHGEHHGYLHAKDCLYSVEKLWTPFAADACPSLAGKPKLFFIQACRGQRLDGGITLRRTETDSGVNSYKIPSIADFLISYSTVDGYYSWRNPENGTWFIRSLCEELRNLAPKGKEFLNILVKVHARVAFQYQSFNEKDPSFDEKKQIPSFVCMLTRCLYLIPKETEKSSIDSEGNC